MVVLKYTVFLTEYSLLMGGCGGLEITGLIAVESTFAWC